MVVEGYVAEQLLFKSGGPRDRALFLSLDILDDELSTLAPVIKRTCIRHLSEGKFHQGVSAVIQFVGQKN